MNKYFEKIQEQIDLIVEKKGDVDPKAKVRNKPNPIFDDKSKLVKDKKDHFPINSVSQARNALARAGQVGSKAPTWFNGTASELKSKVKSAVKKAYPSIDVSK